MNGRALQDIDLKAANIYPGPYGVQFVEGSNPLGPTKIQ